MNAYTQLAELRIHADVMVFKSYRSQTSAIVERTSVMSELPDWKVDLDCAARKAAAKVVGTSRIQEVQHARLVTTAIRAFGAERRATFHVEVLSTAGNIPRPDLILLHPDIGVLVIENKGISTGDIHDVHDTCLRLVRDGRLKEEDPYQQAERVMFRLRDLAASRADLSEALFLRAVALPRVDRKEFEQRFSMNWPAETLFAAECADPEAFRRHCINFAARQQRAAGKPTRLSRRANDAIGIVLSGTGLFFAPRRTHIGDADPKLLGAQVQQLELALKEPTEQQKSTGRSDLRGQHRLFRGVAGSGKSIMLALSVSTTLAKFREESQTLFGGTKRRVLVVCFNKTLVPYLRQKIEDRFSRLAWDLPAAEELVVIHFEGLVRELEAASAVLRTSLTFRDREERARQMAVAIEKLDQGARDLLSYDAVYVDEAQDLLPDEFRLLLRITQTEPRTGTQSLLLFYDNAQNIYGSPTPIWQDLGINIVGRTEFLDTCLRNTRQTVDFAFNVLVGSHAAEGQRVSTRQFADVSSLRQRKLVEEKAGRFETAFAPRSGPVPKVTVYSDRRAEIDGTADTIRHLIHVERVLPSDILVLYNSHLPYRELLPAQLTKAIGPGHRLHLVDRNHEGNKNRPLIEEGQITASTIASAKGYDAPIVLMLGADSLEPDDVQDRATFYVGATRAKLFLHVSGVQQSVPTLLDEVIASARALDSASVTLPSTHSPTPAAAHSVPDRTCRHCGGRRLHAQHGRFGYYYICIDCTENTPIDHTCPVCGKRAKVRKAGLDFLRDCEQCKSSTLVHKNVPLTMIPIRHDGE